MCAAKTVDAVADTTNVADAAADANRASNAADTASDVTKTHEPKGPNGNGGKVVLTNHQKAAYGEKVAHQKMVDDGFEPLGNTDGKYKPGDTGIDGVYRNPNPPPDYVITEAKYNKSRLGKTKDGKQMSDKWVTGSERLEKAGLSQKDINAIKEGLEFGDGTVEKRLIRVKPDGDITSKVLK